MRLSSLLLLGLATDLERLAALDGVQVLELASGALQKKRRENRELTSRSR